MILQAPTDFLSRP